MQKSLTVRDHHANITFNLDKGLRVSVATTPTAVCYDDIVLSRETVIVDNDWWSDLAKAAERSLNPYHGGHYGLWLNGRRDEGSGLSFSVQFTFRNIEHVRDIVELELFVNIDENNNWKSQHMYFITFTHEEMKKLIDIFKSYSN